jgi:starvation-inducible outer membrane lipoprotein
MHVTRKLAFIAVALLVAGCSALPTGSDAAASPSATGQTSVAASDTGSVGTSSTSGPTDGRGGNLFGSGT